MLEQTIGAARRDFAAVQSRRRVLTDSSKILQPRLACSIAALVQALFTLESCHHVVHDEAQFDCYVE